MLVASAGRNLTAIALIVAGFACMGFFGLLLGIADCGPDCQARGERAPVYVLIGLGLGLVVLGAMLRRGDTMRALGAGMLAGGAIALSGLLIVIVMEGGRGAMVWVRSRSRSASRSWARGSRSGGRDGEGPSPASAPLWYRNYKT